MKIMIKRTAGFFLGNKEAHASCDYCVNTKGCWCLFGFCAGRKVQTCCFYNSSPNQWCYWSGCIDKLTGIAC